MNKVTPTYTPDHYVDVQGASRAQTVCFFLADNSTFFTFEPMPDDVYRFFVKEESYARLKYIVGQVTS